MAQAERTTATGEQSLPSDTDGGDSRPILDLPTDRGLVAGTSGDGKGDTAGVEKPPDRISPRPPADRNLKRRWREGVCETLYTATDGTYGHRTDPEHAAKAPPIAFETPGVVRQVRGRPVADFDVNWVADNGEHDRRPGRAEAAPEGL